MSVLKYNMTIYWSFVVLTLATYILSICYSLGLNLSSAKNWRYSTTSINHWKFSSVTYSSAKIIHSISIHNHLPTTKTAESLVWFVTSHILECNLFSKSYELYYPTFNPPSTRIFYSRPCSWLSWIFKILDVDFSILYSHEWISICEIPPSLIYVTSINRYLHGLFLVSSILWR